MSDSQVIDLASDSNSDDEACVLASTTRTTTNTNIATSKTPASISHTQETQKRKRSHNAVDDIAKFASASSTFNAAGAASTSTNGAPSTAKIHKNNAEHDREQGVNSSASTQGPLRKRVRNEVMSRAAEAAIARANMLANIDHSTSNSDNVDSTATLESIGDSDNATTTRKTKVSSEVARKAISQGASTSVQTLAMPPASASSPASAAAAASTSISTKTSVRFLSYNVWFNLELELMKRMAAIVAEIEKAGCPAVVGLQEMTRDAWELLQPQLVQRLGYTAILQDEMQRNYFVVLLTQWHVISKSVVNFPNSQMGRALVMAIIEHTNADGVRFKMAVGTSHLESPIPPFEGESLFVEERQRQLLFCLKTLTKEAEKKTVYSRGRTCNSDSVAESNRGGGGVIVPSVFLADLNWMDKNCGDIDDFIKPKLWSDAWTDAIKQHTNNSGTNSASAYSSLGKKDNKNNKRPGYTYDASTNGMLLGRMKGRLDRVLVHGGGSNNIGKTDRGRNEEWAVKVRAAEIVGTKEIPGLTYSKRRVKRTGEVWFSEHLVLPSDHYGLVVDVDIQV